MVNVSGRRPLVFLPAELYDQLGIGWCSKPRAVLTAATNTYIFFQVLQFSNLLYDHQHEQQQHQPTAIIQIDILSLHST